MGRSLDADGRHHERYTLKKILLSMVLTTGTRLFTSSKALGLLIQCDIYTLSIFLKFFFNLIFHFILLFFFNLISHFIFFCFLMFNSHLYLFFSSCFFDFCFFFGFCFNFFFFSRFLFHIQFPCFLFIHSLIFCQKFGFSLRNELGCNKHPVEL